MELYTQKVKKLLLPAPCQNKHVEVLDGTKTIFKNAFAQCNVEEVIFPDSLKTIGEMAFTNCEMLKNVKFGNGLKVIDTSAFAWCHNLKHIELPSSLEYIDRSAFLGSALKEVGLKSFKPEILKGLLASFQTQPFGYNTFEEAYTIVRCGYQKILQKTLTK